MGQFLVYINGLAILIDGEEVSRSSTVRGSCVSNLYCELTKANIALVNR